MTKLSIPFSTINLESVITAGNKQMAADKAAQEAEKLDKFRGGNSGCIAANGDIYGCHRSAIARSLDIQTEADAISRLFFDAGEGIEHILRPKFEAGWQHPVLCEHEIPVSWNLDSGKQVTGRPDFVLTHPEHDQSVGVELKTIVSSSTAHKVFYDGKPDAKHVIQAAHYMWQQQRPWILLYVSPARYEINHFTRKKYSLPYKEKLNPFRAYFYLAFKDDVLYYKKAGVDQEVPTIVTPDGIKDFYRVVEACLETKQLLVPPVSKTITGDDQGYSHEAYCEYCIAAEEAKGNWDDWVYILQNKGG